MKLLELLCRPYGLGHVPCLPTAHAVGFDLVAAPRLGAAAFAFKGRRMVPHPHL